MMTLLENVTLTVPVKKQRFGEETQGAQIRISQEDVELGFKSKSAIPEFFVSISTQISTLDWLTLFYPDIPKYFVMLFSTFA